MKVDCPECHVEGHLQRRGSSFRVQHYVGFEDGKRIYCYHKVDGMEVSGSKSLEVNKAKERSDFEKWWAWRDLKLDSCSCSLMAYSKSWVCYKTIR